MTDNDTLLNKGMNCLVDTLGLVEAERFITLINAEKFDYTKWRETNLFNNMTVEELSHDAMAFRKAVMD